MTLTLEKPRPVSTEKEAERARDHGEFALIQNPNGSRAFWENPSAADCKSIRATGAVIVKTITWSGDSTNQASAMNEVLDFVFGPELPVRVPKIQEE